MGEAFTSADIKLNGETTATKYYSHPNDTKLYFYLPEGNYNTCEYDGDLYYAAVVANNNNVFILPELKVTGGVLGTDYDYINGVVTVKTSKALTIENFDKSTATDHIISIALNISANITLAGVNIDCSADDYKAAFAIAGNSIGNVTVTLKDDTTNTLISGYYFAGLHKVASASTSGTLTINGGTKGTGVLNAVGGQVSAQPGAGIGGGAYGAGIGSAGTESTANIVINGGIIIAQGGSGCAGIGGTVTSNPENIRINGSTITAKGGDLGAGIGGGLNSMSCDVVITGGSVKAIGGTHAADIGHCGIGSDAYGYTDGTPVAPTDGNGHNLYLTTFDVGEVFTSADIKLNGERTATKYYSHPNDDTKLYFYLPEGNYNTCKYNDNLYYAAVEANNNSVFMLPELKVTGGVLGTDYDYLDGVVTVKTSTALTIENFDKDAATDHRIEVADGVNANITLAGVNIDCSSTVIPNPAFAIADNSIGNVTITLKDDTTNTLQSGDYCAGLQKNSVSTSSGTLTINGGTKGTGVLNVVGEYDGAGIGGGLSGNTSNITIESGIVNAQGGGGGAGIGGGDGGSASHITINGGTVTAISGWHGAGIGSGRNNSASSDIFITGGSVKAVADGMGANIGGGARGIGSGGIYLYTRGSDIIPTDGNGNNLYLTTFDVGETFTSADIKLNGAATATKYCSHPNNDTKLYFYLPVGYNSAEYNSEPYLERVIVANTNTFERIYLKVTGGVLGTDYDYVGGIVRVLTSTPLTIENYDKTTATDHRIEITSIEDVNITLAGVNIDCSSTTNPNAAFSIRDTNVYDVTVTIKDDTINTLISGDQYAGLHKNPYMTMSATLTINGGTKGTGVLNAVGGDGGADIGSTLANACGNIVINGGIIIAQGGQGCAGIGGSVIEGMTNITINGGTITAKGGELGAGIGGGINSGALNIMITGGSVKAIGSSHAADIGYCGSGDAVNGYTYVDSVIPTDGNGHNLFLTTLDIGSAFTSADIKLNGETTATTYYSHPNNDTKLYFYLRTGDNTAQKGTDEYFAEVETNDNNVFVAKLVFTDSALYNIPDGANGIPMTAVDVGAAVSGGVAPYTFSLKNGAPSWLSISGGGVITGTRPDIAAGATTATVIVSDESGQTAEIEIAVGAVFIKTDVSISGVSAQSGLIYNASEQIGYTGMPSFSPDWTGTLTATYYQGNTAAGVPLNGKPTDAGTYTVRLAIPDSDTLYKGHKDITFTIAQKELTISGLKATDRDYDGTNAITLTEGALTGVINNDDVFCVIPTAGTTENANAGTDKAVTVAKPALDGAGKANYTLADIDGVTVTIFVKEVTVSGISAASGLVYNGAPQAGYTGNVTVSDGFPVEGLAFFYESTDSGTYADTAAPTNAGTYKLTVSVPAANGNYSGAKVVLFEISKAVITITAENKAITAGDSLPAFTAIYSGFVGGDYKTTVIETDAVLSSPAADVNVFGSYIIEVSGAVLKTGCELNYSISYVNGTLSIVPPDSYYITASAGEGGTITPDATTEVLFGGNQTYEITPDEGYEIVNVVVDGEDKGAIDSYTFENVTGAHTISVTFALKQFEITASASENGTITPTPLRK